MNVLKKLLPIAVVTVLAAALSTGCKPKVQPDNPATKTTVTLNKSAVDLTVGKSVTLTATLKPADAKEPVSWKSGDPSIATVTNGQVKAVKVGSTTITASIKSGASATCKVTVKAAPAPKKTTIALDQKEASVDLGKQLTLKATLTPKDAKDEITWSSSDEKVATVKDGVVTTVAKGKTTIKASLKNGEAAECVVTVTRPDLPKEGTFKVKGETIELIKEEMNDITKFLDITFPLQEGPDGRPGTFTMKEIKENNPTHGEITRLFLDGTTIQGVRLGTTTLAITRTDNNETIQVKVEVKNKEFKLPEGARIVVTHKGKEVIGVKLQIERGFELSAKLVDGQGKEIKDVEILREFSAECIGADFTNPNRITTSDDGRDAYKEKVIYSVAGTDVKTEIEVDCSFKYQGVTFIYKKK